MSDVQVSAEAVLSAENSILRQENDALRRTLAQHVALLGALQAQPASEPEAADVDPT